MTASLPTTAQIPAVFRTVTVQANLERTFQVFTEGFDTWWPRDHHIGKSPMKEAIIEGFAGGRCYTKQVDGTDCDWGKILVWEPPKRLVMAWLIDAQWQFEADLAKTSEVEICFTPVAGGATRVDLEHRCFERLGPTGENMSKGVSGPGGWGTLLEMFKTQAEKDQAEKPLGEA